MPDTVRGEASFGADHYRPQKHFPNLATAYSNLFYCCNACNSRKGSYWPSTDRAATDYVPNPCDHEMFRHLRYVQGKVEAKSSQGKFTEELLDLNDPAVVTYRENILHMISVLEANQAELKKIAELVERKRASGELPADVADQDLAQINADLAKTTSSLQMLTAA